MIIIDNNTKDLTAILDTIKDTKNRDELPIIKITLKQSAINIKSIFLCIMLLPISMIFLLAISAKDVDFQFVIALIFIISALIFGIVQEIRSYNLTLFRYRANAYCELTPNNLIIVFGKNVQKIRWQDIAMIERERTNRYRMANIIFYSNANIPYLFDSQLPVNYRKLFWVFHDYWLRANHRPIIKIT